MIWQERASCAKAGNPELWHPPGHSEQHQPQIAAAKNVCSHCPVLHDCRAWAFSPDGPDEGILGGFTGPERKSMMRRSRRSGVPLQQGAQPAKPDRRVLGKGVERGSQIDARPLREALNATGLSPFQLSTRFSVEGEVPVHSTTLRDIMDGRRLGVYEATRARVQALLDRANEAMAVSS